MRTTQYGIKSYSNLEAKLWDLLPGEIKNSMPFPLSKIKVENGSLKNLHANFVRHI